MGATIWKTTKPPRHPWSNEKAERVIKTLLNEGLKQNYFASRQERRESFADLLIGTITKDRLMI